jgi:ABC-type sugar transport system ATPase subunit
MPPSDLTDFPKPILSLQDIHKRFGGIQALSGVSFDLRPGEVHALVGENGAGKSTLIKIVTGAYLPDAGTITVGNVEAGGLSPVEARHLGIAAVYQEFNLLRDMSAAENIFLSAPPATRAGLIDTRKRAIQAYELLERLGAQNNVDPNELVKNLTVGEQQIVEIAKALAANAQILIMDEPSAVLPSRDLDRLFTVIKTLREQGHGIIYISHRLNEIFELADRVTVLKDGHSVATLDVADTTNNELIRLMVGRELTDMYPAAQPKSGDVLLELNDLCVEHVVSDVSFQVRAGEIVGLAGLGGSGRTTIARALVGLGEVTGGEVRYLGKPVKVSSAWAQQAGVVLIPEDRKAFGLILDQSVRFNIALPNLLRLGHWHMILKRFERQPVMDVMKVMQVKPAAPDLPAGNLSGGNQQKVVIAKWLMAQPRVIIFDEPTRGIDIGAKAEIYQHIRELAEQGAGIIMASSELPELLGMCDCIVVLHEGRVSGELSRADATEESIMHLATATSNAAGAGQVQSAEEL